MRAKELKQRTIEDLRGLARTMREELFGYRMQNFTNRLDKTSRIRIARRDLARVLTLLAERAEGAARGGPGAQGTPDAVEAAHAKESR